MLIRSLFYLIGLFVLSFGISLTIKSNMGAGAWDALNVGLSTTFGLTVGSWVFIVGIILIGVNAWLHKSRPDYLAIITIFLVGAFIDFWLIQVFPQWEPENFIMRLGILLAGMTIMAIGISAYLQSKFPVIPIDNLMLGIQNRLKVKMMTAKTIGEVCALIAALIFKGPIGIGTFIITFGIGPLIQIFFPRLENLYKKLRHES
ncbi:hypothetical protein FIU87_04300 [Bacillus sp. THAF10]|uniref:YczE/YyaS/YitT family protein n=1 Tax=Bacillus sp. THAF10 TaxID=2587848 RepID=UPI0012678C72|nr:membrane protein [Bacillus sp. THAF10]QFT87868.1 hypothetical protein FIU87_04300 [Bacillus sp. THAF10]